MRVPQSFVEDLEAVVAESGFLVERFCPSGDASAVRALGHYMRQSGRARGLPVLCIGAGKACEASGGKLIRVGAAVDLLYFACVHHDDVADDGVCRHGQPTIHRAWSTGVGVWSGDVLFCRVFGLIQRYLPECLPKVLSSLATAAAADMRQFVHAGEVGVAEDVYLVAVSEKAGLLCGLACELGAWVGNQGSERVRNLELYGVEFGTGFQIVDDARDYGASRGADDIKERGQDFAAGIVTLPVILACQRGTAEEREFWSRALKTETREEGDFERAVDLLVRYEAVVDSLAEARRYGERAKSHVAGIRNEGADGLAWLVDRYISDVEA